jgi:hypothetical protein
MLLAVVKSWGGFLNRSPHSPAPHRDATSLELKSILSRPGVSESTAGTRSGQPSIVCAMQWKWPRGLIHGSRSVGHCQRRIAASSGPRAAAAGVMAGIDHYRSHSLWHGSEALNQSRCTSTCRSLLTVAVRKVTFIPFRLTVAAGRGRPTALRNRVGKRHVPFTRGSMGQSSCRDAGLCPARHKSSARVGEGRALTGTSVHGLLSRTRPKERLESYCDVAKGAEVRATTSNSAPWMTQTRQR